MGPVLNLRILMNRYANNTNIQPMQAGSINAAQFTPPPLPSHIDLNLLVHEVWLDRVKIDTLSMWLSYLESPKFF